MKPTKWNQRGGKWLQPWGATQRRISRGLDRALRKREARREQG